MNTFGKSAMVQWGEEVRMSEKTRTWHGKQFNDSDGAVKTRRGLSALLALLLLVLLSTSAFPVMADSANVAMITGTNTPYATLQAAFDAAGANQTIQLLDDIDSRDKAGSWPLTVAGGKDFILDLAGHVIDRGLTAATGDGCVLIVNGSLTLNDTIPNSTHTDTKLPAGGVITGGKITGSGGGIVINSGAVLTMNGGTIYGNQASEFLSFGGGVYINGGTMKMTGGAVKGNLTKGYGGGIVISSWGNDRGSFTLSGGEVSGNTANYEGGIEIRNSSSMTMSGGSITGNSSKSNNSGGGVSVSDNAGSFTISGGTISGNTNNGVANNVYLYGEKKITVGRALSETTSIGITMETPGVFTNTASGNISYNDTLKFSSDDENYAVGKDTDGQLYLGEPRTLTYNANGGTGDDVTETYAANSSVTLAGASLFTREGYRFTGWNTQVDGSGQSYAADASFTITENTTLYAQWAVLTAKNVKTNVEYTSLQAAFTAAGAYQTIQLLADIDSEAKAGSWPLSVAGDKNFTLDLAGHVIDRGLTAATGDGCVLIVNGSLTLNDTIPDSTHTNTKLPAGGVITGGKNDYGGGIVINSGAVLTMNGGTIYGNQVSKYSGGVYINGGTMKMTGGSVKGNSTNKYGGGIGINNSGSFTLSGGKISGNEANQGGGITINNSGSFTLSGGKISGNKAAHGGGIYIDSGIFTLSGGEISGNTAYQGGGIEIGLSGSMTMSGGAITGNSSDSNNSGGGGVSVSGNTSSFKISGGTISGNTTNGAANNVYLYGEKKITVGGALSDETSIGITMQNPGVFTNTASRNISYNDTLKFTSDNQDYKVGKRNGENEDRQLFLGHSVTIGTFANGSVTADPARDPSVFASSETLTLTIAPETDYILKPGTLTASYNDGAEKTAELTQDAANPLKYTFTMPGANVTVSAEFVEAYTVTFNSDGGSAVAAQTVAAGEKAVKPDPDPTKENVTFIGWYYTPSGGTKEQKFDFANTAVTEDIELKAKWGYSATVSSSIEHGSVEADKLLAAFKETVTLTVTPDDGYGLKDGTLKVTYTEGSETKECELTKKRGAVQTYTFTMPAAPVTVTAEFGVEHKVTFVDSHDETVVFDTQTVVDGGKAVQPADPEKFGYSFVGWVDSNSVVYDFETPVTAKITIYTKWQPTKPYKFTFKPNGGTGTTADTGSGYTYSAIQLTPNGFVLEGKAFASWNTKANGTGKSFANNASVKLDDLTAAEIAGLEITGTNEDTIVLYAQWGEAAASVTHETTVTNYVTLTDALLAAENEDMVTLLKSVTESESVYLGYNEITIDLNGETAELASISVGNNLNVTDSSTDGGGQLTAKLNNANNGNADVLTVDRATLVCTDDSGWYADGVSVTNGGTLKVQSSVFFEGIWDSDFSLSIVGDESSVVLEAAVIRTFNGSSVYDALQQYAPGGKTVVVYDTLSGSVVYPAECGTDPDGCITKYGSDTLSKVGDQLAVSLILKNRPTYAVTYNANGADGGTVPTDSNTYKEGAAVTVLGNTGNLTKTNFVFGGWTIGSGETVYSPDGKNKTFVLLKSMVSDGTVTLNAKWDAAVAKLTHTESGTTTTTYHASLKDAIDKAASGDTITLLAQIDRTTEDPESTATALVNVAGGKQITIDLAGQTITAAATLGTGLSVINVSGSELTIIDSSSGTTGVITGGHSDYGAGIYLGMGGKVTLEAGSITGNTAVYDGGGVYATFGTDRAFTMSGGTISGNTAELGAGIYTRYGGTVTMSGGSITRNEASTGGGGVWASDNVTFTMSGGSITGNTVTGSAPNNHGGGVYVKINATLQMSGDVNVSGNTKGSGTDAAANNVYLPAGKTITVTDTLTNTASVGVTHANGVGLITSGLNGKGGADNFSSDNSVYAVGAYPTNADTNPGEAFIGYKVTYDGNGSTGGTVPTDSKGYLTGDTVTVLGNTGNLTKKNSVFGGWTIGSGETVYSPDGKNKTFVLDESMVSDETVTLNAKWDAAVAKIERAANNTLYFTTLQDAVEAAQADEIIFMINDFTMNEAVTIKNTLTLDLNGQTITSNSSEHDITVESAGNVTIRDGSSGGGIVYKSDCSIFNYGTLVIASGRISGEGGCPVKNYGALTVSGGNIKSESDNGAAAIISDSTGSTAAISGSAVVSGENGIEIRKGAVTISGGTVSGTGTYGIGVKVVSGSLTVSGGAVSGTGTYGTGVDYQAGTFSLSGAPTISGNKGINIADGNTITITDALTNGEANKIGVTLKNGTGVFTSGLSGFGNAANFSSDEGYTVGLNDGGEAILGYTVTFNANGGTGNVPERLVGYPQYPAETETPAVPAFNVTAPTGENLTKTGYHINGWSTVSQNYDTGTHHAVGAPIPVSADITLYAEWDANSYTVKFDKNADDATGTMEPQIFLYDDEEEPLSVNAFSRSRYVFNVWNTAKDGTGTAYGNAQRVKNLTAEQNGVITLYAQWAEPLVSLTHLGQSEPYAWFGSLQDAFNAAVLNDTATLLSDISTSEVTKLNQDKIVFLDLAGHTITGTDAVLTLSNGAVLTLRDSSAEKSGAITSSNDFVNVTIDGSGCEFNMEGGTLSGGSTVVRVANGSFALKGGTVTGGVTGVEMNYETSVYLSGGQITDNTGKGINVANPSVINLRGPVTVTGNTGGNVYLPSGRKINIPADVSSLGNALVGVTLEGSTGVFTTGLNGKGSAANFSSDEGYEVGLNSTGEAILGFSVTYIAGDDVIGTAPVDSNVYLPDDNVTILGNVGTPALTKENSVFKGWKAIVGWSSDPVFEPNDVVVMDANNITLRSAWDPAVAKIIRGENNTLYFTTLQGAVAAAQAGETIIMIAPFEMNQDVTIGESLTLNLNGQRITSNSYNINVTSTDNVTITSANGGEIRFTYSGKVVNTGTLTISGGTISNEVYDAVENSGSLTISGGTISSTGNIYPAVTQKSGTLSFTGGTVTGTYTGVKVDGGSAAISGGTVSGTGTYGVGVRVNDAGSLTVSGGTISNSETGVVVSGGTFSLTGGTITGNGTGVSMSGSTVSISGGSISNNTAMGIDYRYGTLKLSGAPTISGNGPAGSPKNVNIAGNNKLTVDGNLTGTFGITLDNGSGLGIFTTGLSSHGSASNFTSDNPAFAVGTIPDEYLNAGEAFLGYTVTYYAGDSTGGTVPVTGPTAHLVNRVVYVLANSGNLMKTADGNFYLFRGWTKSGGDGTVYIPDNESHNWFEMPAENVTLVPVWVQAVASLTVDAGDPVLYAGLQEAFDAAAAASGSAKTVTLLTNLTSGQVTSDLNAEGTFTFDLNGKTLSTASDFNVKSNGNVTITGTNGGMIEITGNGYMSNEGTLTVSGGTLQNTSGISVIYNNGTLNINGGNIHTEGDIYSPGAVDNQSGGIVNVSGSAVISSGKVGIYSRAGANSINITGGTISGDETGVDCSDGSLTITGGTINGGTGAGVDYQDGTFNLSGAPTISGSKGINIASGKTISITGTLTGTFGVTLESGTGVFTSGLPEKGSASNFTSDVDGYTVGLTSQGEAILGYTVTYNGNGNTEGEAPAAVVVDPANPLNAAEQGTLVKTGYSFAGWNTHPRGTGFIYLAGDPIRPLTGDLTLYSQWTRTSTKVSVSKLDAVSGNALVGAALQVLDPGENVKASWTSTEAVHVVEGLETGVTYTLHETAAPTGYAAAEDVTFTLDASGTVTTSNGELTDEGVLVIRDKRMITASADPVDVTYDASAHSITLSLKDAVTNTNLSGATVKYGTSAGSYTLAENPEYTNAGVYTVFYQVSKENYETVTGSAKVTIAAKSITVSVEDKTVTYTGSEQSGNVNYTFSGLLTGHIATISYTPAKGTNASATAYNNGSYGNDLSVMDGTTDVTANYSLADADKTTGKLTINKASNPMTLIAAATVKRGGSTVDLSGNVSNAQGSVSYTITEMTAYCSITAAGVLTSGEGVGTCTVQVSAAGNENYEAGSGTIIVTVSDKDTGTLDMTQSSITYGETLADPSYERPSGEGTETVTYSGTRTNGSAYGPTAGKPVDAGSYTVGVTYETADTIYTGSASFDIAPKSITVSVADKTVSYTGAEQTGESTPVFDGLLNGHTASISYIPSKGTDASATAYNNGSYGNDLQVLDGETDVTANYSLADADKTSGKLTINKAANPMTLVSPVTVRKGGNTVNLSGNVSNAQGSVSYSVTSGTCTIDSASGVLTSGANAETCTVRVDAAGNNNYEAGFGTIIVNVTDKDVVTVTVNQNGATYGETLSDPVYDKPAASGTETVTYGGIKADGSSYGPTAEKPVDAGSYTVGVTYETSDTIYTGSASFDIAPKSITVSVADKTVSYTGAEQTGESTPVFDGLLNGHTASISYTPAKGTAVGTYTTGSYGNDLSVLAGQLDVTVNYDLTQKTAGKLTILETSEGFTVIWKNYDGTVLEMDENVPYGAMPSYDGEEPVHETEEGVTYVFDGWDPAVTEVTGDAIYTAKFTSSVNTYTVTWMNWDETVLETDENVPYGTMPSYDGEEPVHEPEEGVTYTFDGWDPEVTNVTGDAVYTAKFIGSVNTYTVTWKNYDGTVLETDENVPYGAMPSYDGPEPTREDPEGRVVYTFAGWNPAVKEVTEDAEYTALFASDDRIYQVKVTSDENGTAYADPTEGPTGTEVTLVASPKANCQFVKWEVVKGDVTVDNNKFVIMYSDVEIQAVFEAIENPFDMKVTINNIMGNGSKGAPEDINRTHLDPTLILRSDEHETSGKFNGGFTVHPKEYQIKTTVTFANEVPDISSAVYEVLVEGLPRFVSSMYEEDNKYLLTADAWINNEGGITINLIWTDKSWVPDNEVYVFPLPEDEIGAYKMDPWGKKEYLIFHTYDICMRWLGDDGLCSGYERCFHKELPYIYDKNKIRYGYDWNQP